MKQVLRYLREEAWYGDDYLKHPYDVKEDKYIQQGAVELIGFRWKGEFKKSYLNSRIKNNKDLLLAAVKKNGYVLDYASKELKNDKEVVLAAVKEDVYAIDTFLFDEDPLLTKSCRKRISKKGDPNRILKLENKDGLLVAQHNIVLSAS